MLVLVLSLFACAPHPTPPAPAAGTAPAGDTVSPPVTLDQFRAAFPVGTTIRLRIEAQGAPPVEQWWEWTAADAEGCTIRSEVRAPDGTLLQDEGEGRSTWRELMGHAEFPAATTEWTESSAEVPAGRFDTWLYTVRETAEDGDPRVKRYHFARTMPGPPVLFTIEQGAEEVFRMTLIARSPMP